MIEVVVRSLAEEDFAGWSTLWQGYLDFYREQLPDDVSTETFARLVGDTREMFGLVAAARETGELLGMVNCLLHPSTWSQRPTCYLEDLYVHPSARGSGAARELIEGAEKEAAARGADKIYWHTQQFNGRARSLYDQMARLLSVVVYEQAL